MSRPTLAHRARRAGLVLGGAMLGAAALLAAAAGPAAAAEKAQPMAYQAVLLSTSPANGEATTETEDEAAASAASALLEAGAAFLEPTAPRLLPPSLLPGAHEAGEARFETMPSFLPAARAPRAGMAGGASIAWRATKNPWLAAGLTVAGPAALALPALAGVWAPVAFSPLALAAGHCYAGDLGRGALVGLGGVGVTAAGAAAGFGLGTWLGAPLQGAMLAGGGLGLGAYTAWAAADAFGAAGARHQVEVVSISERRQAR